jgi:hypothetical protein
MTPDRIADLLDSWRNAERLRDGSPLIGGSLTEANEAVERARQAYLEAIRSRAAEYGYAGGERSIEADIAHLHEAEDRRGSADRSTPAYHLAAQDVHDRALGIVAQVITDEAIAARERLNKKLSDTEHSN